MNTFPGSSSGSSDQATSSSLDVPPLFAALDGARRVLLAGAGGGFDVYAALPLAITLWNRGVAVHLANLSFTPLETLDLDAWPAPDVALVAPATHGPEDYFPERILARWLAAHDLPSTVYAFARTGVQPLRAAYRHLTSHLGIDAYHGVVHSQVLENLAALDRDGGYLGALSIPSASREAALYRDAVADAQQATPMRPSIVQGQIAAATRGAFGDVQFTRRTAGSTLFVNPLMAAYFTVDLVSLANRCLYLDRIEQTADMHEVAAQIDAFRRQTTTRPPRVFPH
ncbi:hypothetical protein FHR83_007988 [Actinoplanes campanulatus]|uniref:DUF1152 domain-containing protein n=1 Tax=Actinoplanes campanulatus TaxID=113559 RepID=A0A7W5AQ38_9ACTN|nr:hypothetical protein [Actinoplanes campanulatus]MBB3100266.1 hypothetical protein [Actinoplanes campanulatus]